MPPVSRPKSLNHSRSSPRVGGVISCTKAVYPRLAHVRPSFPRRTVGTSFFVGHANENRSKDKESSIQGQIFVKIWRRKRAVQGLSRSSARLIIQLRDSPLTVHGAAFMALRSWRILTIVLLLASAAPPPRVTNALIAATDHQKQDSTGKSVQSRARNRIGSTLQIAACLHVSGLSRGALRPRPSTRSIAWKPDRLIAIRPTRFPIPLAPFRLRC